MRLLWGLHEVSIARGLAQYLEYSLRAVRISPGLLGYCMHHPTLTSHVAWCPGAISWTFPDWGPRFSSGPLHASTLSPKPVCENLPPIGLPREPTQAEGPGSASHSSLFSRTWIVDLPVPGWAPPQEQCTGMVNRQASFLMTFCYKKR